MSDEKTFERELFRRKTDCRCFPHLPCSTTGDQRLALVLLIPGLDIFYRTSIKHRISPQSQFI